MQNYSRYNSFTLNGSSQILPFISIPKKNSDFYEYYKDTRLDLLSYKYYGDANYGWLILQANPEYGSLEFNIPSNSLLRIPYPLSETLNQYEKDIKTYKQVYGLN